MTSVKVKFTPSSVILKEGSVHYQRISYHAENKMFEMERPLPELFPSEQKKCFLVFKEH